MSLPDDVEGKRNELTLGERLQVEAAEGWLMLGNPVEAEKELDQIDPARSRIAPVLGMRWWVYHTSGWTAKRNKLCPVIRPPIRILVYRVIREFGQLCAVLLREGCKSLVRIVRRKRK